MNDIEDCDFGSYGSSTTKSNGNKKKVDYKDIDKHKVESAKMQKRAPRVGYVTSLVDLGVQDLGNNEDEWKGSEQDELEEIAKNPKVSFVDKMGKRWKVSPRGEARCCTFGVTFPKAIIDEGNFFGKSDPKPLTLFLGGSFYEKGIKKTVVGKPISTRMTTKGFDDGVFSLAKNNTAYMMAAAAGVIENGDALRPEKIGGIIGKAMMFETQVFFKQGSDGKEYYNEYIKFNGALPEGMDAPKFNGKLSLIRFDVAPSEDSLSILRGKWHILNTIERAKNFEGSELQKALLEAGIIKGGADVQPQESVPQNAPQSVVEPTAQDDDDFDPFGDGSAPF